MLNERKSKDKVKQKQLELRVWACYNIHVGVREALLFIIQEAGCTAGAHNEMGTRYRIRLYFSSSSLGAQRWQALGPLIYISRKGCACMIIRFINCDGLETEEQVIRIEFRRDLDMPPDMYLRCHRTDGSIFEIYDLADVRAIIQD